MTKASTAGAGEDRKSAERQRLAAALRANLGRRKTQGRERQAAQAGNEQRGLADDGAQAIAPEGGGGRPQAD